MTRAQFRKTDFFQAPQTLQDGARTIVIAVDGPAASGKGTLAYKMAQRLGLAYLDTGALYRAVGLATLETGGDPSQYDDVAPALAIIKRNITPELLASPALRTPEVSDAASKVAALPEVRLELLEFQRDFARNPHLAFGADMTGKIGGAVLDGRDIGTVVCPDADIKFFITANPAMTYETVLADMKERDARDTLRKVAPTIPADNAYIIDTSSLNASETLEEAIAIIRARFLDETNV